MRIQLVLITRFSFGGDPRFSRMNDAGRLPRHLKFGRDYLRHRIRLFESVCLPSVLEQTDQDFSWVILISPMLDSWVREQLESLTRGIPNSLIVPYRPGMELGKLAWIEPWLHPDAAIVATINLDDDDGLPRGYLSAVRTRLRESAPAKPRLLICGASDQWDMVSSAGAAFGWTSPEPFADYPASCGLTLACPRKDGSTVLSVNHRFALTRYPSYQLYDLANDGFRTLISNHFAMTTDRLYRPQPHRRPVAYGSEFSSIGIDWDKIRANQELFRKSRSRYLRFAWRRARTQADGGLPSQVRRFLRTVWRTGGAFRAL